MWSVAMDDEQLAREKREWFLVMLFLSLFVTALCVGE